MGRADPDLVIIGGGPAGSLAAALVRRQDPARRVLLLERARHPRHHVGESSIPSWRPVLERAGVLEKMNAAGFMPKVGTLFWWGEADDESWTLDFRDPKTGGASPGSFQVDRARLDRLLLDHARALGAEVLEETELTAARPLDGGGFDLWWRGPDGQGHCTSRFVVDASGQGRALTRLWNLKAVPFDDMNNFAVYGYWRGSQIAQLGRPLRDGERWTYISACEDGWVWHIPIAPDLVSVGLVTDAASLPSGGSDALEPFYRRNVLGSPKVGPLLERAELAQHPEAPARLMTVRDWSYLCDPACGPGWFLCGDAAAFVDPILSSGLLLAANGASMVANALHTLWNDPSVDEALLLDSYRTTYRDMVSSYHSLAGIWYSRNFKYQTWHWEARRQRLSTGGAVELESEAEAFLQLCLGSFANPVEGAFADRGLLVELARPDAHIYTSHLYPDATGLRAALGEAARAGAQNDVARELVIRSVARRWRRLLPERARVQGCTFGVRDGYFTDGTMTGWQRVRYVEVLPDGAGRHHDRVVFPSLPEAPQGVLPLLDGTRSIGEALRAACAGVKVGTPAYDTLSRSLSQQASQLAFRGLLTLEKDRAAPVEAPWPAPAPLTVALGVSGVERAGVVLGVLGESLELTLEGVPSALLLYPAARAASRYCFRVTQSTALAFRGRELEPRAAAFFDRLLRVLESPGAHAAMLAFWAGPALAQAGALGQLDVRSGLITSPAA
jgi:flavin-dependent dehydrogenase